MRFGEKCKEKTTKMTEDSPRVTDLINNANFLLNVSVLTIHGFSGRYQINRLTHGGPQIPLTNPFLAGQNSDPGSDNRHSSNY